MSESEDAANTGQSSSAANADGADGGIDRTSANPLQQTESAAKKRRGRLATVFRVTTRILLGLVFLAAGISAGWWARGEQIGEQVAEDDGGEVQELQSSSEGLSAPEESSPGGQVSENIVPESARPVMPDVVGLAEAEAWTVLKDADATSSILIELVGATGEPGVVLGQTPAQGEPMGGLVTLLVSEQIATPQLVGGTEQEAVDALVSLGADGLVESRYVHGAEAGIVLEMVPAAGEPLRTEATIVVAEAPSTVFLSELTEVENTRCDQDSISISGVTFRHSLSCSIYRRSGYDDASMEFVLNRRISRFAGTLGLSDFTGDRYEATFAVSLDDQAPVTWSVVYGESVPFDIDVSGALRMRLEIVRDTELSDVDWTAGWGDAVFVGSKTAINDLVSSTGR